MLQRSYKPVAALALIAAVCSLLVAAACRTGSPPKTSLASLVNPTTQTDWYFASVANGGNDSFSCGSATPCVTISGGMIPKLGVLGPNGQLGQTWGTATAPIVVTLHMQYSQTLGQELALLTPQLIGPSTTLAIVGTPQNIGSTFAAGTNPIDGGVTLIQYKDAGGNPGAEYQIPNMPDAALAGMLLTKTAQADGGTFVSSAALIQYMDASTAIIDQPQTLGPLTTVTMNPSPVEDTTWGTGDTLQLASLPLVNLEPLEVKAGDTDGVHGGLWLSEIEIPDQQGDAGQSKWRLRAAGGALVASLVKFDPNVIVDMSGSPGTASIMSCQFPGGAALTGNVTVYAGSATGVFNASGNVETLTNGFAAMGNLFIRNGTTAMNEVYCASTITPFDGLVTMNPTGLLWGPCIVNLTQPGTAFWSQGDSTTFFPTMYIASSDGGTCYDGGGLANDKTLINAAHLDTCGALYNPLTGSRFTH